MTTNRTTLAYVLIMREGEGGDHMFILNPDVFMLNCCGKFEGSIWNRNSMIREGRYCNIRVY